MLHLPLGRDGFRPGERLVVTRGVEGCVDLSPDDAWEAFENLILGSGILAKSDTALRHQIRTRMRWADEVRVGCNGSVEIPAAPCSFAGLDSDVLLVGVGDHAELWDVGAFVTCGA